VRPFIRRQFDESPTTAQTKFDIVFGVALPVACFLFDPFVFRGFDGDPHGLLESYQFFTYTLAAMEMAALGVWLAARGRLGEWSPAAGGVLLAGALFCFAIGVVLLPFSLVGLVFIIGALGFTPFFTGFVYLRNGVRAVRMARNRLSFGANFLGSLVVGAALVLCVPALAGAGVSRFVGSSMEALLAGRELSQFEWGALRAASFLTDDEFEQLVSAYGGEADPARRARLAVIYRKLTGRDVERRPYILDD
jgi:hypothetical protein